MNIFSGKRKGFDKSVVDMKNGEVYENERNGALCMKIYGSTNSQYLIIRLDSGLLCPVQSDRTHSLEWRHVPGQFVRED